MSAPGGRQALPVAANLAIHQNHDENAHQHKQHPGDQSDEPGLAAQLISSRAENGVPAAAGRRQRVQGEKDGRGGGSRAQAGEGEAADEVDGGEGEVGEDEGGGGGRHHEVSVYTLYK